MVCLFELVSKEKIESFKGKGICLVINEEKN